MTEEFRTGLYILLAAAVLVVIVAAIAVGIQKRNADEAEESGDLEHFDHDPSGSLE